MNEQPTKKEYATEEQRAYAALLDIGWKLGFVTMVITFFLYTFGIMTPHIPLDRLTDYWSLPAKEYLVKAGLHGGWSWVHLLHTGDFLNFIGIAFLSSVTALCYGRVIPILVKNKETVFVVVAVLEIVVLVLAASGILVTGH